MNSYALDLDPYEFGDKVVANFVVTGRGAYQDERGSSRGISNGIDRQILVHLRSRANAVLVGGETARVEGYKQDSRFQTLVLTNRDLQIRDGLTRFMAGSDSELKDAIASLWAENSGLLVEAGPTLVAKLAELVLIDILCLTIIDPVEEPKSILKSLFKIENAELLSSQQSDNTLLTIWKLR